MSKLISQINKSHTMRNRPDEKIVEMEGRSVLSFLFIYISAKHFYIILLRINYTAILRYHYSIVQKTDSKGASSTYFFIILLNDPV